MPLTQTIGLEQLSEYFHMPINEVAKDLGVCATVLKKICRRNGIPRWPHRKIKSLDKMIKTLETTIAKKPEDEERIKQEIATLRNKKMFLMKNPNVLMKGSKSGSKYKGAKSTTSSTSTTTTTNTSEKTEWNTPSSLMSSDFTSGALQQEEAAKSLLNVFASLQNKLQDQPKDAPSSISTECSAWYLNSMEPQMANAAPSVAEQKALFSLELPKLVLPEESPLVKEKKLSTMEPLVGASTSTSTNLFAPAPLFAMGVARQDSVTLPSWFLREKEQYDAGQQVFASPLSLNALCNPSPRTSATSLSSILAQHQ